VGVFGGVHGCHNRTVGGRMNSMCTDLGAGWVPRQTNAAFATICL